ncbi:uncharacterized protein EV422DRAFT_408311 [Fimicolochytrium jonesii]|uniref:uncharacterized protein n=1 Tax=Fimicolochytrium jonesii TaxID=1396493 RepID=UPI0022FE21C1|nr:uncharacterized protein EV422DRAFT_408311 [Fimicolochytrium jonesii]KAI8822642.1 hypothetical protein EV422DRAFT_408311 [Fimicolochytrium jonesii]
MTLGDVITGLGRGATRGVLSAKQGNKNYYKGTGSGRMGRWTARGRFILEPWRFRQWMIPKDLSEFQLHPYIDQETPSSVKRGHSFRDYFRPHALPETYDKVVVEESRKLANLASKNIARAMLRKK